MAFDLDQTILLKKFLTRGTKLLTHMEKEFDEIAPNLTLFHSQETQRPNPKSGSLNRWAQSATQPWNPTLNWRPATPNR